MVDDDEEPMWDVEFDDETLSQFYDNRLNLVLDSVAPHLAPHIVITPPEETWEDQYISWKNRVDFQWPQFLEVPALNVISGRLPIPEDTQPMFGPGTLTPSFSPTNPLLIPTPIFSHSKFRQQIDSASMERLVFTQVVAALHKAQCKAVFFYASNTAYTFRKRYDLHPNVLSTLDQSFAWTDPAEPLLAANRRLLGTTIIDSVCPFRAPHIIINAPPPQPPQITECNATPYAQDAAFGQRLIVRSCSTEIVNAADDWDQYASSYDSDDDGDAFSDADQDSADPLVSDDGFSRPGTPAPGTPVDEDDDHDFFYARHGDDGHDHDNMRMHTTPTTGYASYGYGYRTSHAAVVEAVLVVASAQGKFAEFQATSRPMFFIEEDEDELPSLDDW
ncbi:hypothetical protein H0H81_011588 [Sphagnurus paluster]|uniref:Uncharacterized protein n=1 Tax=Sphagnurus paluster TaxID=117069 RepID=A0A9P7KLF1_9AGAR|nr:hypothetical protein H0H81_011588 [Sphagnurus paluster]